MKLKKSCSNCLKGKPVGINNDIFCREKGIVSPDFCCSRHRFLPETKPAKEQKYMCIDCANFTVVAGKSNKNEGVCELFRVRPFDGCQKSACSKFVKNVKIEVV